MKYLVFLSAVLCFLSSCDSNFIEQSRGKTELPINILKGFSLPDTIHRDRLVAAYYYSYNQPGGYGFIIYDDDKDSLAIKYRFDDAGKILEREHLVKESLDVFRSLQIPNETYVLRSDNVTWWKHDQVLASWEYQRCDEAFK